jgi:hypothetical protein
MQSLYEEIRTHPQYNKFTIGDLLFAEYTCPIEERTTAIWTHTDYLVFVLSGKKTWRTTGGTWIAEKGQTLFFKKVRPSSTRTSMRTFVCCCSSFPMIREAPESRQ